MSILLSLINFSFFYILHASIEEAQFINVPNSRLVWTISASFIIEDESLCAILAAQSSTTKGFVYSQSSKQCQVFDHIDDIASSPGAISYIRADDYSNDTCPSTSSLMAGISLFYESGPTAQIHMFNLNPP